MADIHGNIKLTGKITGTGSHSTVESGTINMTGKVVGTNSLFGNTKGDLNNTILSGKDGKSAYESAIEGGYTGTEQEFYIVLAKVGDDVDYTKILNKPSIEGVTLIKDKTFEELGMIEASNLDIEAILQS